jgi:isoleucyl-tRNA synthetase
MEVREDVFSTLEVPRREKQIGSNQEASVEILTDPDDARFLEANLELLTSLCIVSEIKIRADVPGKSRTFLGGKAPYPKCERCWNLRASVGEDPEHPTLCERCVRVLTSESDGA